MNEDTIARCAKFYEETGQLPGERIKWASRKISEDKVTTELRWEDEGGVHAGKLKETSFPGRGNNVQGEVQQRETERQRRTAVQYTRMAITGGVSPTQSGREW